MTKIAASAVVSVLLAFGVFTFSRTISEDDENALLDERWLTQGESIESSGLRSEISGSRISYSIEIQNCKFEVVSNYTKTCSSDVQVETITQGGDLSYISKYVLRSPEGGIWFQFIPKFGEAQNFESSGRRDAFEKFHLCNGTTVDQLFSRNLNVFFWEMETEDLSEFISELDVCLQK